MNDKLSTTIRQLTGQVRSMVYLLDEPTTILTIQIDGQTVTARAFDQVALDLRALPRGVTMRMKLDQASSNRSYLIAFTVMPTS
jgi:hypothetical protein